MKSVPWIPIMEPWYLRMNCKCNYFYTEIYCHELSLCGSLRSPPEGTVTRVLTVINSISHIPRTCGWFPAQVFHIDSGLFKPCFPSPHCEVLFCYATISERLSCVWFPVYDLDCLLDSDSPPPAYFDPTCLVYWLPWVFAASPDPKPELWLWFCLAYVASEACDWTLPVWLAYLVNKAAHGSECPWLLVTYIFKKLYFTQCNCNFGELLLWIYYQFSHLYEYIFEQII